MDRRTFTKSCIFCLTGASALSLFTSCQSTFYTSGTVESNGISVSRSDFSYLKNGSEVLRDYIIVRNEAIEFPIYVYRFSDNEYSAVLMKCSHQGNELQASGDHLHCNAHGSEFNNKGTVVQGPAEKDLRKFNVVPQTDKIFIDLRA
jgi:Rieske Fe-S protein